MNKKELQELIADKKKVTIPKFVAEYIEEWKESLPLTDVLEFSSDPDEKDTMKWLYNNRKSMNDQHAYLFVRAWFEGYEVEEQLYQVKIPTVTWNENSSELVTEYAYLTRDITSDEYKLSASNKDYKSWRASLTEAEIKAMDDRYWAFAEEVVEYEK